LCIGRGDEDTSIRKEVVEGIREFVLLIDRRGAWPEVIKGKGVGGQTRWLVSAKVLAFGFGGLLLLGALTSTRRLLGDPIGPTRIFGFLLFIVSVTRALGFPIEDMILRTGNAPW
jgi:hypothetical protein